MAQDENTIRINQRYTAERGEQFLQFITNFLKQAKVSKKYRDLLLNKKGMAYFDTAFTHSSYNSQNNYEVLETLGDVTVNKAVVWYLIRKFPNLYSPDATDVLTKLKIHIISSKTMGDIAEKLGFLKYISYDSRNSVEMRNPEIKQKILEDVFESFFGAMEFLLDQIQIGVGYSVCYKIISQLLDKRNYGALRYEDLVDAKTRLKELFDQDIIKSNLGKIVYLPRPLPDKRDPNYRTIQAQQEKEYTRMDVYGKKIYKIGVELHIPNGKSQIIAVGEGYDPKEATVKASQNALDYLESMGYKLNPPSIWKNVFC